MPQTPIGTRCRAATPSSSRRPPIPPTPPLITSVAGAWSGPVRLFGAGSSVRLTCTDFSSPPRTGTSVNITVNPASLSKLQVILPGETAKGGTADGKDGAPNDQMAGT